ncbi:MAG: DUF1015 domain-containing protein [Planctomycetaceae bacterium]|jgi:uncharacterized protein (DUF1015 family)|nr:DUF1015 domain-containing protein [Planctomycetaceae bacterium]
MPVIQAFRGLRYNLARVGSLSECIAPPYDVIDANLQDQLYNASPHNFVRLEYPKILPNDSPGAIYDRAGRTLRSWQSEKILQPEPDPAIYVYHQQFEWLGQHLVRRGLMANVRLERFGEGKIYPHEHTHAQAKEDRLQMLRACRANLSQIFGLYPDPTNRIQELLEAKIMGVLGTEAVDHLGVRHTIWPISDLGLIQEVSALLANLPMFVADGHHRYETACNYRDELAAAGILTNEHPANYVLSALVSMSDPGLVVLPTHRLVHGIPRFTTQQLHEKLSKYFDCELVAKGSESAGAVWAELDRLDEQLILVIYSAESKEWTRISAKEAAIDRMAELAPEHSSAWRELGVAVLHTLVFEDALGLKDMPKPTYVHQVQEVIDGLTGRGVSKSDYSLAAMVMPASIDQIQNLSLGNERMPAKSTYFFPKLASGLVVHSLE